MRHYPKQPELRSALLHQNHVLLYLLATTHNVFRKIFIIGHSFTAHSEIRHLFFRFLVYDPYDHYFPFAIETFKVKLQSLYLLMLGLFSN